jgi:hypothetical protein
MAMKAIGNGLPVWLPALLSVVFAGCAAQAVQRQTPELRRDPIENPTIVVMPLDVELGELTAGGVVEPNAEWTEAAVKNLLDALQDEAERRKVSLVEYRAQFGTAEEQATGLELIRLHRVVGNSVLLHHYIADHRLPGKASKFDWSLGSSVDVIARSHDADYALFLYVRDSYTSGGRAAMIVAAAVLGVGIQGGTQVGFSSIVDLKTGEIIWFNRLARGSGDLRTPQAAAETAKVLVGDSFK